MAYALPIVAKIADGGVTFIVRALPWGLAREADAIVRKGDATDALSEKVYERCVEVEDGEKPPVEDLPASLVARLVKAAAEEKAEGEGANPSSPPPSTAPDSGG